MYLATFFFPSLFSSQSKNSLYDTVAHFTTVNSWIRTYTPTYRVLLSDDLFTVSTGTESKITARIFTARARRM